MKKRTTVLLLAGTVAVAGSGAAMAWASSSSDPPVPTECASGVVASQIPGFDHDPDGIGPVFVDTALSKVIYGDSVNVLDGISAEEAPAVKEIAAKVQWCFVQDSVEGDHWEAFIPGFDAP